MFAGSAPERSVSERSATSSVVKLPWMMPSLVMRLSMRGADTTRLSSTIASERPTLSPVTLPNLREPSLVSWNLTAGLLFSSIEAEALRRSAPVTAATLRTR